MPYVAKTEDEKKALAADRERVAETNKQAWLTQANYDAAEDDALAEAFSDANDEVDSQKVDSKTAAEMRLKAHNTIKARFAADRAAGVWPLIKAEREAKAANDAKALKERQDKVAAEAKAAAEARLRGEPKVLPGGVPLTQAERDAKNKQTAGQTLSPDERAAAASADAKLRTPPQPFTPAVKPQVGPGVNPPAPQVGPHA